MRLLLATLCLVVGCYDDLKDNALSGDDSNGGGNGSGSGANPPTECKVASDCAPAGPKCCDCPTHAVPIHDPGYQACEAINCPTPTCPGAPMVAACEQNKCVLVCKAVACPMTLACDSGFATDENGCLTCACAMPTQSECNGDGDCARVRADCCGCMMGGNDTAVPAGKVAAWEAQLMCPANPSCPMVNTCAPDLSARCVAGECTLVSGGLPPNACGRADLPACGPGEACTVNASDQATMQGVGVCLPAP